MLISYNLWLVQSGSTFQLQIQDDLNNNVGTPVTLPYNISPTSPVYYFYDANSSTLFMDLGLSARTSTSGLKVVLSCAGPSITATPQNLLFRSQTGWAAASNLSTSLLIASNVCATPIVPTPDGSAGYTLKIDSDSSSGALVVELFYNDVLLSAKHLGSLTVALTLPIFYNFDPSTNLLTVGACSDTVNYCTLTTPDSTENVGVVVSIDPAACGPHTLIVSDTFDLEQNAMVGWARINSLSELPRVVATNIDLPGQTGVSGLSLALEASPRGIVFLNLYDDCTLVSSLQTRYSTARIGEMRYSICATPSGNINIRLEFARRIKFVAELNCTTLTLTTSRSQHFHEYTMAWQHILISPVFTTAILERNVCTNSTACQTFEDDFCTYTYHNDGFPCGTVVLRPKGTR